MNINDSVKLLRNLTADSGQILLVGQIGHIVDIFESNELAPEYILEFMESDSNLIGNVKFETALASKNDFEVIKTEL